MPTDSRKPNATPVYPVDARRTRSLWRWACVSVFLLALAARAAFGLMQMAQLPEPTALQFPDECWYWEIALSVHAGDGLTGEFGHRAGRMPLYPGLLALAAGAQHGVIYVRVAQWLVGAMGAYFVARLGMRVAGPLTGTMAGMIFACDPGLVGVANLLLTETLFVTLVAAWWTVGWPLSEPARASQNGRRAARRRWIRWALTAVLAAACVYARPGAAMLVPMWAAFVCARRRLSRRAIAGTILFLILVVGSLVPWGYRNQRVTGEWCWLTTRAGISLYDGVRPGATGRGDLADVKSRPEVAELPEHEWNRYFTDCAWDAIRADPGRVGRLGLVKLARTWSPVLHAEELSSRPVRLIFAAWSLIWYTLIAVGVWTHRRDIGLWIGLSLPAVMICLLHFFYVGSVRYRLGATPTLAVLAALGIVFVISIGRTPRAPARPGSHG